MAQKNRSHIFLCYRRSDTNAIVDRAYNDLRRNFSKDTIIRDLDSIPPGVNFSKFIEGRLRECRVVLVFIGNGWLKAAGPKGERRLFESGDHVRKEIETALEQVDVLVIPVLVNDARMPRREEMPEQIADLVSLNALPIRDSGNDYQRDLERLTTELGKAVGSRYPLKQLLWSGVAVVLTAAFALSLFKKDPVNGSRGLLSTPLPFVTPTPAAQRSQPNDSPGNEVTSPATEMADHSMPAFAAKGPANTENVSVDGAKAYNDNCVRCHSLSGIGVRYVLPPLTSSKYLSGSPERFAAIILNGMIMSESSFAGPKDSVMPSNLGLSDGEIAAIMTFARANFSKITEPLAPEFVAAVRKKFAPRGSEPWTEDELGAWADRSDQTPPPPTVSTPQPATPITPPGTSKEKVPPANRGTKGYPLHSYFSTPPEDRPKLGEPRKRDGPWPSPRPTTPGVNGKKSPLQ